MTIYGSMLNREKSCVTEEETSRRSPFQRPAIHQALDRKDERSNLQQEGNESSFYPQNFSQIPLMKVDQQPQRNASSATANSLPTIQGVFNQNTYRLAPNATRHIYVEAGNFAGRNLQAANLNRAVLHETMVKKSDGVALATRYNTATANFRNAVGLTVALNDYYQNSSQVPAKQAALQQTANQMIAASTPPININVVKVLWQDGRQDPNESIRGEVPFAELRRRAASDVGATALYQDLETQAGTVWRKMGDDDMPFPNPNDVNIEINQKLAEVEQDNAEMGDQGNLISFNYNLTPASTNAIVQYLCREIYRAEAITIDSISEKYAMRTYAIEPTTYYRAPGGQDVSAAWNDYENHTDPGNKQIKEGASFAKSLMAQYTATPKYLFLNEAISTSAGGRLTDVEGLLSTAINPTSGYDRDGFVSSLRDALMRVDQSIWDEETLIRGAKWMYTQSQWDNSGLETSREEINQEIREAFWDLLHKITKNVEVIRGLRRKYPNASSATIISGAQL
ncbi:hypothetical protein [Leptolyngbya sp. AN10]|uniref:hypothetical protein n=1 Tax=Leptolyngbya sp. AN10 TaxID=3423365 RepID=UPI003D323932